jgi:PAS domain S-box-containing protein
VRAVIVGAEPAEVEALAEAMRRAGFAPEWRPVAEEQDYLAALDERPDLILAGFTTPALPAARALALLQARRLSIPFVVVAGPEDDAAVELLHQGATDLLFRGHTARLGAVLERALAQRYVPAGAEDAPRARPPSETISNTLLPEDVRLTSHASALLASRASALLGAALLGAAPLGSCVIDEDGTFIRVNAAYAAMLGYQPHELIGQPFTTVFAPDVWVEAIAAFQQVLARRAEGVEQRVLRRKDGTPATLLAARIALSGPDGRAQLALFAVDVEERRRTEEAGARLAAIVAGSSDAIIGTEFARASTPERFITSWNAGAERLYGYSAREAVGRSIALLAVPGGPDDEEQILAALLRREPVVDLDTVRRHRDGHTLPVSISVSPIRDAGGTIIGAASIHRDIGARKAAEERARDLAELLDLAHDAVIVRAADTSKVVAWSRGAEQLYGWPDAEAVGRPTHELLATVFPQTREAAETALARDGAWEGELTHRARDGRMVLVESRQVLRRDEAGHPEAILEINRDITARRRAEDALARANADLQALLRVLPIGIGIATDARAANIRMNPALATMLGLPPEANASLSALEGARPTAYRVLHQGRELAVEELPMDVAMATGQEVRDVELEIVRDDGVRLKGLASAAPLFDEQGRVRGAVLALLDITARMHAERQRDVLLASMAHDLKNPLSGLAWLAHLLREHEGEMPPSERARILDAFVDSTQQMMLQINELVDAARIQMRQPLALDLRAVDLAALVARVASRLSPAHPMRVTGTAEPRLGLYDELRLARALSNVLGNAVKYSAPEQEVSCALSFVEEATGTWAVIRVSDHGIGIPTADIARVFEPYYRAANARGQAEGTGLGLAGVRQIVAAHGGTVTMQSVEGVGTTVTLRLPHRAPPGDQETVETLDRTTR